MVGRGFPSPMHQIFRDFHQENIQDKPKGDKRQPFYRQRIKIKNIPDKRHRHGDNQNSKRDQNARIQFRVGEYRIREKRPV